MAAAETPKVMSRLRNDPATMYFDDISATLAPVPEPATWAMMILGFGAAGAMLRRGRILA